MSKRNSKTVGKSAEETRQNHVRYLRVISNPLRREILKALKKGHATAEELQTRTGPNNKNLKWHLSVLEQGFCVEKELNQHRLYYKLTQEGRVVDYLE